MKKAFWWILGILLSPVLLFVVLAVLLYLPPVQNWVVDKVASIASEKTGMQITVGHVNLSFPLDLAIDDFRMIHEGDTIADVENMVVDVQLLPLLDQRVVINALEVTNTSLNTNGYVDAARVKGTFGLLSLKSRGIDLGEQTVEVNGARLEDARLDIQLNDSVPEDTTTTETLWKIMADSVTVVCSDVALHMPGDTMSVQAHLGELVAREAVIDLGSETYTVASADWRNGALQYDQNIQPRMAGLDYNHLDLSSIQIGIDKIYYHDPTLRFDIRHVALKEQSGLQLTGLSGPVAMEDGVIKLPKMRLTTPYSDVYAELDIPLSLTDSIDPGTLRLRMDAQLGRQDLLPFLSALPQAMQERWPLYPLSVKGQLKGNLDFMEFSDLDVSLPTAFSAKADGFVANLNDMKRLRADVQFKAQTQSLDFVTAVLPRDVQRNYRIPNGMSAEGRVRADGADYFADVTVREDKGSVALKGRFNADAMRYDADMVVRNLNVHHFMPRDSIYTVTADIAASGQGIDLFSPRTTMDADIKIDHLRYGSWNLDHITAKADIRNGRGRADVESHNALLDGVVSFDALMDTHRLEGKATLQVNELNLYKLQLSDIPITWGISGQADIHSDTKLTHSFSGRFTNLSISDSTHTFHPADIGLLVKTRPDTTYARVQSGDFIVKFDASGDYERLLRQLTILGDSVASQYKQRIIDQPAIRRLLPTMKLHVESKRDNPLVAFLQTTQHVDFQDLIFDLTSSVETGLNGSGYIHSLKLEKVKLDTINFRLTQRDNHLSFGGQVRNNKKNPDFVFNALFDGVVQESGATLGVRYYDVADRLGVRLGAQVEMVEDGIRLHLVPNRPTIGYKEFNLNSDNYILLRADKKVKTKIDLVADDGTGLKVYSEDSDPSALQDITISLNKLNLAEVTSTLPYVPRMTGLLNGDYHVVQESDGHFSIISEMAVQQMTYEGSPVGNLSTELIYMQKEGDAHAIEARLMKNNEEIGVLTGTYYNKREDDGSIDANFQMARLPLSLVNGFIPDQLFGLHGYGEGDLTIKGRLSSPQVDGEIFLDSAYLESVPYGVMLRFDHDPVRIVGSKLLLENFTVYAYNDNPLNIQGDVDFTNLERIMVNMRMRAQNFQLVGAKENPHSVAYGKVFVNILARMSGPLDKMSMRGRLDVLGSTDMGYILRDTPLSTDNQLEELVKFTDFSDTTQVVIQRPALDGFQMDMTIDISKGAHVMAYLNTDHSNYIDLMGGGTLRMQYTPADNLQLRGRYTLSNGEMKYSLQFIPLKTFTIQDGSYIEFTGDPMDPTLNIKATERVRAAVAGANGTGRSVAFDCGVVITKTLNNMGVEFVLDAPEDMQLHNELMSMGIEQRGKLAVTMLTTGMYLADGNTGAFSMNSALSSFLSSEINNITGNALRTLDLSVGMDNSTDASGNMHTDYSFKFAKRFMDNRLKIAIGGKVSTGAELQQRNNSFLDNVSLEYRLDQTANKFITLFYQNNSYDWLDGYTQKYGGGFTWRRSLNSFWDIFRFKESSPAIPMRSRNQIPAPRDSVSTDTLKIQRP